MKALELLFQVMLCGQKLIKAGTKNYKIEGIHIFVLQMILDLQLK
jgi:hypothetical protein